MKEQPISIHIDCSPGLTLAGAICEELPNALGGTYWKATAKIGSIFGSQVEGEICGIGKTREQAIKRLAEERKKLYDSLWD